eukprot:CAMPEP_0119468510 /NCGR_PEP_ID=MMETSP1344-20130328/2233_1 /TAXON_ID=236787 /ORGANISM="Florenciella parvula, Strain CCMP2471" /LENGTH=294 /DNA_ID=CAMNT_0007500987 /DNA_START=167 /DNA_END=1051 /DNA_ORIENTATION=+
MLTWDDLVAFSDKLSFVVVAVFVATLLANTEWSKPLIASWLPVKTEDEAAKPAKEARKGRKGEYERTNARTNEQRMDGRTKMKEERLDGRREREFRIGGAAADAAAGVRREERASKSAAWGKQREDGHVSGPVLPARAVDAQRWPDTRVRGWSRATSVEGQVATQRRADASGGGVSACGRRGPRRGDDVGAAAVARPSTSPRVAAGEALQNECGESSAVVFLGPKSDTRVRGLACNSMVPWRPRSAVRPRDADGRHSARGSDSIERSGPPPRTWARCRVREPPEAAAWNVPVGA